MGAGVNQVTVFGNLTRDPDVRTVGSERQVCNISLAVNERIYANKEWKDVVNYIDVELWGRDAETASKFLTKGAYAGVLGHLKLDTWEKDGERRSKLKVVARQLILTGGGKSEKSAERQPAGAAAAGEDELPF